MTKVNCPECRQSFCAACCQAAHGLESCEAAELQRTGVVKSDRPFFVTRSTLKPSERVTEPSKVHEMKKLEEAAGANV